MAISVDFTVVAGSDWAVLLDSVIRPIDGNVLSILKTKLPLRRLNRLVVRFLKQFT